MSSGVRIKFEPVDDEDTRSTIQLYNRDLYEDSPEDRKPIILSLGTQACIELSSDEDVVSPMMVRDRRATARQSNESMKVRHRRPVLVVKDVETQTDFKENAETSEKAVNTDVITATDVGVTVDVEELLLNTDLGEPMDVDADSIATVESSEKDVAPKEVYFQCKICSCYYNSFKLLQKHSVSQHNKVVSADHKKVKYGTKCKFCASSYIFATYNQHIKTKHMDRFNKNSTTKKNDITGPYECKICKLKFLSYNEAKRHRGVHDNIGRKFILRKISNTGEDCQSSKAVKVEKTKSPLQRQPIPKSVLFQCPKCQLNFFNYRNGLRHRIRCEKGEVKRGVIVNCAKCEKRFLSGHIKGHYQQHEMTVEFKIQPIVDGIEHKIIYRCMKCKICMEEKGNRLHFQSGCKTVGIPCTTCNLKIDKDHMSKHKEAHGCMGLTREEIILVDVCD